MKNSAFLVFMLILFSVLVIAHAAFRERMSPVHRLESRIVHLQGEKRAAEFRAALAAHQLADYQQQVATLIPAAVQGKSPEAAFPLRNLASVAGSGDALAIERASGLLEKAKSAFRDKLYEDSNRMLEDLIARYPQSAHLVEAHFLLAEGQYQLQELEAATETIETMITVFPDNDLTGFALLRLGKIFESQDRLEDAGDIYRATLANFKRPEIVKQAQTSLKAVAL